jgi:hypothetical protein
MIADMVQVEKAYIKTTLDIVGVTILGMELNKLKSSSSSPLDFEKCYHHILEQNFIGMFITFINAFVPLRWLRYPQTGSLFAREKLSGAW